LDTVNAENAVASGQVLRRRTTRRYRVSGTDCVQGGGQWTLSARTWTM